jgi:hypothetical protein
MSSGNSAAEKGGCLFMALSVLGIGAWILWPGQPIPVNAAGLPLEHVQAEIVAVTPSNPPGPNLTLDLRFPVAGQDFDLRLVGSPKSSGTPPMEVGRRLELWFDPADPRAAFAPALGQKPSGLKPAPRSTWLTILGALAAGTGAFGLFAALTSGGGSKAPGARPGEDDRH